MSFRSTTIAAILSFTLAAACDSAEERAQEHYERGLALAAEGDFDRAIVELRNVFKLDGSHLEARRALAEIMRNEKGNLQSAYGHYLRLAEQYPDDLDARIALGEMAFQISNWDELERHAAKAEELAPDDVRVKVLSLTRAYRNAALAENTPELRKLGREVATLLETLPENEVLRGLQVDSQLRDNDYRAAVDNVDWLIERNPEDLRYWRQRINLLVQLQDFTALEAQLRDMVARFPDDNSHKTTLLRFFMSRQQPDKAEAFLRELSDAAGETDPTPRIDLIRFVSEIRGLDAALAEAEAAIADQPDEFRFRMLRASLNFSMGQQQEAIRTLESELADAEDSPVTRNAKVTLARMLLANGNLVGARARVEEVLAGDPEHVEALKMQAAWLIEADDIDGAVNALRTVLDKSGEDAAAMTLMAQAHTRAGRPELARDFLALAVDASGNAPAETIRYARLLMSEDRFRPAEDVLMPALRLNPQNFELLVTMGQLYLGMEDYGRADQVVQTLRDLEDPRALQAANTLEAERINRTSGPDEAIRYLEGLASDTGGSLAAQVALLQGRLGTGDVEGALDLSREMLAKTPDNEALQAIAATVAAVAGELDEAEQLYRALLEADPRRPRVWMELSRLEMRRGNPDAANAWIEQGLDAVPDNPSLLWARATALERTGDIDGAIDIYEKLYAANSSSLVIANNLASLITTYRTDAESLERAWVIARRLKDTDVPALQDTYGWILHRRGDSEAALPYLEAAAAALTQDPIVQYHLGMAYLSLNRPEDALRQFRQSVSLAGPADRRDQIQMAREQIASLQQTTSGTDN